MALSRSMIDFPLAMPWGSMTTDPFNLDATFPFTSTVSSGLKSNMMNADFVETDMEFKVFVDMPGCDDAEIHEEGDMIKFVGDRTAICQAKTDNCVMHCNERDSGKYMRTFKIPAGADMARASAEFKNGVMMLTVPKHRQTAPPQPRKLEVKHIKHNDTTKVIT